MREPLLKSTTSPSVVVPSCNEQHLVVSSIAPLLDRAKVIRAPVVPSEEPSSAAPGAAHASTIPLVMSLTPAWANPRTA
jgi:hypothetical protein